MDIQPTTGPQAPQSHGGYKTRLMDRRTRCLIALCVITLYMFALLITSVRTDSMTLRADALDCISDMVSYSIYLYGGIARARATTPPHLPFGYDRVDVLGGFTISLVEIAMNFTVVLQCIGRLVDLEPIVDADLMLYTGCAGIVVSALLLFIFHEHDHGHQPHGQHDHEQSTPRQGPTSPLARFLNLGVATQSVIIHIVGDMISHVGVIVAAALVMKSESPSRHYADPAFALGFAILASLPSFFIRKSPLLRRMTTPTDRVAVARSARLLLDSSPASVSLQDLTRRLLAVPGVSAVSALRVRAVNETRAVAHVECLVCPHDSLYQSPGDGASAADMETCPRLRPFSWCSVSGRGGGGEDEKASTTADGGAEEGVAAERVLEALVLARVGVHRVLEGAGIEGCVEVVLCGERH